MFSNRSFSISWDAKKKEQNRTSGRLQEEEPRECESSLSSVSF